MNEDADNLTQSDLRYLGFTDYLIREICKVLVFTCRKNRQKLYKRSEIIASIQEKISKPKIKPQTRERLQVALAILNGKSNVIEVDFLKKLKPQERIEVLKNHREELRQKGEEILKRVDELLKEAKTLL